VYVCHRLTARIVRLRCQLILYHIESHHGILALSNIITPGETLPIFRRKHCQIGNSSFWPPSFVLCFRCCIQSFWHTFKTRAIYGDLVICLPSFGFVFEGLRHVPCFMLYSCSGCRRCMLTTLVCCGLAQYHFTTASYSVGPYAGPSHGAPSYRLRLTADKQSRTVAQSVWELL